MQFGNTSDKASMSSVHLFPLKLHSNQWGLWLPATDDSDELITVWCTRRQVKFKKAAQKFFFIEFCVVKDNVIKMTDNQKVW